MCSLLLLFSRGKNFKELYILVPASTKPCPTIYFKPKWPNYKLYTHLKPGVDKTYFLKRHIHYNHTAYIRDSPLPPTTHFQLLICGSVTQKKTLLIAFNLKWTASSFQQSSHRKWSKNLHCVLVEYTNANILDTFIHKDQLTLMR